MISEPELEGSSEFPEHPADAPDTMAAGEQRRSRPVWQPVLAGALAASVLWAGGLLLVPDRDRRPPIRYENPAALCEKVRAEALTRLVGNLRPQAREDERLHETVDVAWCALGTLPTPEQEAGGQPYLSYEVTFTLELHKKADPAVEFDAGLEAEPFEPGGGAAEVAGLGERALMYGSGPGGGPRLKVLDGGAVFTLETDWYVSGNDWDDGAKLPPDPEEQAVQAAMINDMRAAVAALRTGPRGDGT
ncbi:hypothetical protein DEJ50_20920 [Streptomyces venezuelae]|uniref:Uncharacterized protein n=1 Tax=Streptomyces venezuelae TaxID=54571 RepID=A0A5P2D9V3_STRVZ|nr:hypothetical protein [Streptomyces venezuelae]QES49919.1 hypothetical protein DEJ50_20920 [Streptomyces venezuelae]